jgi:DNA-binding MarR family transcriptional regulator
VADKTVKTFFQVFHKDVRNLVFFKWSREELLVWLILKTHANAGGTCFPGFSKISKYSGLNRPQIARGIKKLEARGIITVARTPRKAHHYRLLV